MTAVPKARSFLKLQIERDIVDADLSSGREGRWFIGRNDYKHYEHHRDRGPSIQRKICRDNVGKDLLAAGACSNLQRLETRAGWQG